MCDKESYAKLRDQTAENTKQIAAARDAAAATTNEVTIVTTP